MRFWYWWGFRGSGFWIGWGVLRGCLQRRVLGVVSFGAMMVIWGVISGVVGGEVIFQRAVRFSCAYGKVNGWRVVHTRVRLFS